MSNGCPMCLGFGRIVAMGGCGPILLCCPECAGLAITPASADDPDLPPAATLTQRAPAACSPFEMPPEVDVYGDDWLDAFGDVGPR